MSGSDPGTNSSGFETEQTRPVRAVCDNSFVCVTLADSRQIRAPFWWYPFLQNASSSDRGNVDLMFEGVWWPAMDEGVSVKGLMLGWKAPGARQPQVAAE